MIDISAIPDRFEDAVGKTERHDVLDGFFSQVVIDAVNLFFANGLKKLLVQCACGLEITPDGLALLARLDEQVDRYTKAVMAGLTAQELRSLDGLLNEVRAGIEPFP